MGKTVDIVYITNLVCQCYIVTREAAVGRVKE